MPKEYKQNTPHSKIVEEDNFEYDPEKPKPSTRYSLPFALCKQRNIPIQDWWTPRDAWNALKRQGVDPSKEYSDAFKEARKKEKRESARRSAEEKRKRDKIKREQLKDPSQNPTAGYQHEEGKIDGARKSSPMNFEKADSGSVNPNYKNPEAIGYHTNCQTCVATYFARRMGYDVQALPNLNNRSIYMLSMNVSLAYKTESGNHPTKISIPPRQTREKFIESQLNEGEIGALQWGWKGKREGHIISVEKVNGKIRFYDPQTNKVYTDAERRYTFSKGKDFSMIKLSGCTLDEKFCDKVMKGVKKNAAR